MDKQKFAEQLQESCMNGASQSDIIQMVDDALQDPEFLKANNLMPVPEKCEKCGDKIDQILHVVRCYQGRG